MGDLRVQLCRRLITFLFKSLNQWKREFLYSNFEKLGFKYGLSKLILNYDTPITPSDTFAGTISFVFVENQLPLKVDFRLSQHSHSKSGHPTLEINWANLETNGKLTLGENISDNPDVHAWIIDNLLEVFAVAVQQTYLEIIALCTSSESHECGTKLPTSGLTVARRFVNEVSSAHLH